MRIEKDLILNLWVVWEYHDNYMIDKFKSKTKKQCKEWVKKNEKI